jgi:hypothetical protein
MDFAYAYNLLPPFERVLRRDRAIVGIALLISILLAWLYVGRLATSVQRLDVRFWHLADINTEDERVCS